MIFLIDNFNRDHCLREKLILREKHYGDRLFRFGKKRPIIDFKNKIEAAFCNNASFNLYR